ncbi:hypothetical protein KFL_000630320 [Klebsormidium nitens]|uniref:SET domain-containing protein n=1 Tax=Klebsormidium nitens TaxID=105231 RepID=A0A1Y1HQD1_KLENI|nr:hypothetical protein KFL_000630320 [Klebsormidium nitens]|eukprot:GAQ80830.1 hypothetical protein KFL_000630320 [Klebsormidium nitens]
MEPVNDDTSVVQSSGASLTSATQRRPSKASEKEQAKETGNEVATVAPLPPHPAVQNSRPDAPVVSTKAIIASIVLTIVIAVNMNYGWYQDRLALDRPPLDKDYALYKMLQWMEAGGTRGALPPSAKMEVLDDLGACKCIRGVAATHDIQIMETILEIPFDQVIFDSQVEPLPKCTADAQWDVRLAAALLREKNKGPKSPFFYYIQALPDEILAAVTLDEEDLEKVKYETGRAKLAAQRPWMETLWVRCLAEAPELIAHANWHEFRWAIAVVQSRSFSLVQKRAENQAYWETSPDGRSVFLKAARSISAGEELCDSYGKKGNDELLISYGFITRDNAYEYVALFDTVEAAIDWLFEAFPCRSGPGAEVVSRPPDCREEVLETVRKRLEDVPVSPIIQAMKDDPATDYYVHDIPRMSLFVNGTEDTRLTAAFEAAFSQACFLCARDTPSGTSEVAQSIQSAVDEAKELVARASGIDASSRLASHTVNGRTDLAVKLRVLELLKPLGISFGDEATSTWRRPTRRELAGLPWKEQVLKEYNDSKIKLLLARLDSVSL